MSDFINVRRATPNDASTIAGFNRDHALEVENMTLDHEKSQMGVDAVFSDPSKGCYFVTERGDEVVGSLLITYEWSDWRAAQIWWIQSVYVMPSQRGNGAFNALFKFVENEAHLHSSCELKLYVVNDNNPALKAYERVGMYQSRYVIFEKVIQLEKR